MPCRLPATFFYKCRLEWVAAPRRFYSYFFPPGFVMETLTQPPDGGPAGRGLRAFGTLRERGAHSALPGKQLDATKSRVGAGGARRSAQTLRSLPPPVLRRRPPLAGGCELHLVKPSPGIYRSLERNEVGFGEKGGGRFDSHIGQRSGSTTITARTPTARPARRQRRRPPAGAEAAAERRGGPAGGSGARSRRVHASRHFQSNSGVFHTLARG